ncbi:MAG: ATP-dependent DNA helicase [Magnetococcales bacterium]|nr:ATP-dependent DNA helicase [Magnetococcales bacterium]NGZ27780.1 ATP-dependent DNA helicase [Magnetococcales bacterium]
MNQPQDEAGLVTFIKSLFGPDSRLSATITAYEPRPAQMRMAHTVVDAILSKQFLVMEAGTGTGKTLGYLLPLLEMGVPMVVSTATKALQDQIVGKDLPLLRRIVQRPFRAALLKGRNNYLCNHRFLTFMEQGPLLTGREGKWLKQVADWAADTVTGDRDELRDLPEQLLFWPELSSRGDNCLGQECPELRNCFLAKARGRAKGADLVVVNHHLFFADLSLKEEGFGELLPNYRVAIFDEAHQIPDVVTTFFGVEISNYKVRDLAGDCRREMEALKAADLDLSEAMLRLEEDAARLRSSFGEVENRQPLTPDDLVGENGRLLTNLESSLRFFTDKLEVHRVRSAGLASCGMRAEELIRACQRIRDMEEKGRVRWWETRGRGVFFRSSPLEPGESLEGLLYPRLEGAIFTSATLATGAGEDAFRYFCRQMKLPDHRLTWCRLPPVFDYGRNALLYLPPDLPEPDQSEFGSAMIERLVDLLTLSRGRAFCLFTSHRMMQKVREGLQNRLPYPILCQGELTKPALLDRFLEQSGSILLATGSFWEGVDVPGEALSMVVVDRLPFASPGDPINAARCHYLTEQGGKPFTDLSIPEAVLSLKQGLGRLLRRTTDRGVMAVMDVRLSRKWYGRKFLEGLPPAPICRDLDAVAHFFATPEEELIE